jgi:predicted nucleic acid-binding Zn ribbon protein
MEAIVICNGCGKDLPDISFGYYKDRHGNKKTRKTCRKCLYEAYKTNTSAWRRNTEYRAKWNAMKLVSKKAVLDRKCHACGKPIPANKSMKAVFCSKACKSDSYRKQNPEKWRDVIEKRNAKLRDIYIPKTHNLTCSYCGKAFTCKRSDGKFCSDRCRINDYRGRRYRADVRYKLECIMRGTIRTRLCDKKFAHLRDKSSDLVGCSWQFLADYLEARFKPGMTWDNHGEWEIDHIRPCASFDLVNRDDQRLCFHYTNLQPLWKHENRRKSDSWEAA